jgi:hypothetical protein
MSVHLSADNSFGYIDGVGALVRTGTGAAGAAPGTTASVSLTKNATGSSDVAFWGSDNGFPQQVVADAEANTSLATMLNWKAKAWYGGGLCYGLVSYDESGEEVFKQLRLPQVEEFMRRSNVARYAMEALIDISWFGQAFIEVILTRNRQEIYSVSALDTTWCRYAKAKRPQDLMKLVYYNANWTTGGRFDDEYSSKIPVLDPYYDAVAGLRARKDSFNYIYPISFPSPDKSEYQLASWNTVRRSGWLDIGRAVVEFKKMLLKNILNIEWMIEINPAYWHWKYKEWDEKSDDDRRQLMAAELKNFGDVMSGSNGAGKSLMTTTVKDSQQNDVAAFKVTALDKKMREGLFNEDSQESASHVFTAGGVAPTLMGIQPGKNMGAGSGSDARVAFNNFISTSTFEQHLVLEVLHFIRDYNNWPAELEFRFKQPLIMTLDKGKQTQQQTA